MWKTKMKCYWNCCILLACEFHKTISNSCGNNVLTARCSICLSGIKHNMSPKLKMSILAWPLWVFQSNFELWASDHQVATVRCVYVGFCRRVFLKARRRHEADSPAGQSFTCCRHRELSTNLSSHRHMLLPTEFWHSLLSKRLLMISDIPGQSSQHLQLVHNIKSVHFIIPNTALVPRPRTERKNTNTQ